MENACMWNRGMYGPQVHCVVRACARHDPRTCKYEISKEKWCVSRLLPIVTRILPCVFVYTHVLIYCRLHDF